MSLLDRDFVKPENLRGELSRLPTPECQPRISHIHPWDSDRWQLVSLHEMLLLYAKLFLDVQEKLAKLENDLKEYVCFQDNQGKTPYSQEEEELLLRLLKTIATRIGLTLDTIDPYIKLMGLRLSPAQAVRIRNAISSHPISMDEARQSVKELRQRIEDELKTNLFLHVPVSREVYYNEDGLFGKKASRRFSKIAQDMTEAGKCLALNRYTAAVFHLMRAMELGVRHLAKKPQSTISINVDRAWGPILKDVDNAVRALPGASHGATPEEKARYEMFAEIASYLRHVKDAWRNPTMHPERTYTEEQSDHLFKNVKTFMESLIKIR